MLLLDTHVLLWLVFANPALNRDIAQQVEQEAAEGRVHVSPVNFWEIGNLVRLNRVTLIEDALDWSRRLMTTGIVRLAPFTADIAVQTSFLPGKIHRDPADRMLIATARAIGARLVTHDRRIIAYAEDGHLSVMAV